MALNEVWPDERFEVSFDRCQMRYSQRSSMLNARSVEYWWLADLRTDPDSVRAEAQLMCDASGRTRKNVTIIYEVQHNVKDANAADRQRYMRRYDQMMDEPPFSLRELFDSGGLIAQHERQLSEQLSELYKEQIDGEYVPFLARNHGGVRFDTETNKDLFHIEGFSVDPLVFVFKGDVLNGLLTDIHAHRIQNC
ncbi:hypothetical protein [Pseudaestuariivita rosea]|uniref:hypothetical protein n=1 Tax=Pseudaestuariivita rosea TaxID=2763263 RepID=UPI001ABAE66B|nr:hypothetical protein [Pseudaestuariivita rosea]